MTHGVTEADRRPVYSNDAGGLNEATSDIMGTMVEFYANNANDVPDYMIGEKIYRSNPTGKTALRYMFRPGDADGEPLVQLLSGRRPDRRGPALLVGPGATTSSTCWRKAR